MGKINEFINNDELIDKFNKLKKDLFYETSHLSDLDVIKKSKYYKEILSQGKDFLPFIIDNILKGGGFSYRMLLTDIVGDITDVKDITSSEYKKIISNWWSENKVRYGE
jgi:hypothetical protein